jgi:hypothetical protein
MAVGLWGPRPSAFQRGQLVLRLHRLSLHPRRARAGWGSTPRAGWPFGRSAADLAGSAGNTADTLNSAARRSGGTGRRRGLKIPWPQGRSGSSPGSGTTDRKVPCNWFGTMAPRQRLVLRRTTRRAVWTPNLATAPRSGTERYIHELIASRDFAFRIHASGPRVGPVSAEPTALY